MEYCSIHARIILMNSKKFLKGNSMKLSSFILNNIEPILVEWENFAKSLFKTEQSKRTLRDDAKKMLLVIAQDLQQKQSRSEQTAKSKGQQLQAITKTAAENHGIARMDDGFSINELAAEYRALRASVIKLWGNACEMINPSSINDIIRFNEAIDQLLHESIDSYARSKEQQARHFNTMLSSSPDLSFVIDKNGLFLYVNNAMSELYQQPIHNMIGKAIYDLLPEEQVRVQFVFDTGETCRGDMIFKDPSGMEYFFEYIYTPIFDENEKIEAIAGNSRDITQRKHAEKN